VAYGSDISKVTDVLTKILVAHKKVLKYPPPSVLVDGFGDNSVDFRLLIWTLDIDNWLNTRSELSASIYNALDEAGISIPFPQRDLHIVSWEVPNAVINPQTPENPEDEELKEPNS
jgi:small-conductance mechanosensitive channel